MHATTVLFDLDGTLLPMDQERFVRAYFGLLARTMAPLGYAPDRLLGVITDGIQAMVQNDGAATDEDVFWRPTRSFRAWRRTAVSAGPALSRRISSW